MLHQKKEQVIDTREGNGSSVPSVDVNTSDCHEWVMVPVPLEDTPLGQTNIDLVNDSAPVESPAAANTQAMTVYNAAASAWTYAEPVVGLAVKAAPYAMAAATWWYGAPACAVAARAAFDNGLILAIPTAPASMWSVLAYSKYAFDYANYVAFREHSVAAAYNWGPRAVGAAIATAPKVISAISTAVDAAKGAVNAVSTVCTTALDLKKAYLTPASVYLPSFTTMREDSASLKTGDKPPVEIEMTEQPSKRLAAA